MVNGFIELITFLTSSFPIFAGTCILIGVTGHAIYKIALGIRGVPEPESKDDTDWL